MPKENQIRTLTSHIYGPYYDYTIFKDNFPADYRTLEIRDVQMFTDKGEIGFDKTEFIGKAPEGSVGARNESVVFFGVLTIESLDWLSERGQRYLERDLREHDETMHLEHNQSGLTLAALYGDRTWKGSRLRVMIAADKNLPAHFLTSRDDPDKLIMFSYHEGKKRRYWIQSLHVTTFSKSRNFFDRYRLRAVIEELIATDPENTPVEDRNIDWLIQRYLSQIHPKDVDRRIITDPELDPSIYSEPRHPNHLPRARIRHFFAAQSEWILAHMLASSSKQVKLLDLKQWIGFCHEARVDSIAAKKHSIRWGVPHGEPVNTWQGRHNLSHNLAKFGETQEFWKRKLEIVNEKKEKASKTPTRPSSPKPQGDSLPTSQAAQFQYDSDFSEPSTPGEPDDSDADETTTNMVKVPEVCMTMPKIPSGRMAWTCPTSGCGYQLDLLEASRLIRQLAPDYQPPTSTEDDKTFRTLLLILISSHYETHLAKANVELFRSSESSASWEVKRVEKPGPEKTVVKEETNVDVEPQVRRSSRKPQPRKQFES